MTKHIIRGRLAVRDNNELTVQGLVYCSHTVTIYSKNHKDGHFAYGEPPHLWDSFPDKIKATYGTVYTYVHEHSVDVIGEAVALKRRQIRTKVISCNQTVFFNITNMPSSEGSLY